VAGPVGKRRASLSSMGSLSRLAFLTPRISEVIQNRRVAPGDAIAIYRKG
jgi:hypothetical protein